MEGSHVPSHTASLGLRAPKTELYGNTVIWVLGWAWATCHFCLPLTFLRPQRGSDWVNGSFFSKTWVHWAGCPSESSLKCEVVVTIEWINKCEVLRTVLYSAHGKCQINAVAIMKEGTVSGLGRGPVRRDWHKLWLMFGGSVSASFMCNLSSSLL